MFIFQVGNEYSLELVLVYDQLSLTVELGSTLAYWVGFQNINNKEILKCFVKTEIVYDTLTEYIISRATKLPILPFSK